jgi:gliding motility-associated-like protein
VGEITITPDSSDYCIGSTLSLSAVVSPAGTPQSWTENGNPIAQTGSPITISPTATDGQTFTYLVTATSTAGCSSSSQGKVVKFKDCFGIPDAFTPNGDGQNNTFIYVNSDPNIVIQDFKVFNRWGGIVFDDSSSEKAWDGKVNGSDAPIDVYYYLVNVKYANGTTEVKKGEVTLLR